MTKKTTNITRTAEETEQLGFRLAGQLYGRVILLKGDLGAGKTTFVQGLAAGLGVEEAVTSPTFVYEKDYFCHSPLLGGDARGVSAEKLDPGESRDDRAQLCHFDLYRLEDALPITISERLREVFADKTATVVIEWSERIPPELLPQDCVQIQFKETSEGREISMFQ